MRSIKRALESALSGEPKVRAQGPKEPQGSGAATPRSSASTRTPPEEGATILHLTGGAKVRAEMPYDVMRGMVEAAIAQGKLLELRRSDHGMVCINPHNVDYMRPPGFLA